jgi:hypothetical protein
LGRFYLGHFFQFPPFCYFPWFNSSSIFLDFYDRKPQRQHFFNQFLRCFFHSYLKPFPILQKSQFYECLLTTNVFVGGGKFRKINKISKHACKTVGYYLQLAHIWNAMCRFLTFVKHAGLMYIM